MYYDLLILERLERCREMQAEAEQWRLVGRLAAHGKVNVPWDCITGWLQRLRQLRSTAMRG